MIGVLLLAMPIMLLAIGILYFSVALLKMKTRGPEFKKLLTVFKKHRKKA